MRINVENSLFCLVDVQERLYPHILQKEELKDNLLILIRGLKLHKIPFIINEQYKKGLGNTVSFLEDEVLSYVHIEKTSFSCCKNDSTLKAIKDSNKQFIILAGIETHVCVLQTCLDLLDLGLTPVLVTNCVSSRKKEDKDMAITRLVQAGVIPTTYESLLFELTIHSKHEQFKEISKLVK